MVCIHTENQNQGDFYPFVLLEISVLYESNLGHLRYSLTDVPPQPNSPPDNIINPDLSSKDINARSWTGKSSSASLNKQKNDKGSGILPAPKLPPILYPLCLFTMSN